MQRSMGERDRLAQKVSQVNTAVRTPSLRARYRRTYDRPTDRWQRFVVRSKDAPSHAAAYLRSWKFRHLRP